ncbi:MAG TPA: EamA/RhaT family transporter [Candidatus Synoicihabitans sp.]|nr:EamA/RhaT family transporter [Candidatus Synoicihabitans sp.]
MAFPLHLLFPLGSSLGYVAAVLVLKRSAAFGIGLWRTTFVSNVSIALGFAALWPLGGASLEATRLWQPAVGGALFFLGQVCTFLAIQGDVSVATPVLGVKIILVAFFSTWLLASPVPLQLWCAAALSTAAIALLNRGPSRSGYGLGRTVTMAAGAALSFALSDVLVQKWTPAWGAGRFLPLMFGANCAYSLALVPFFRAPLWTITAQGWRWLLAGCALLALQAASMAYVIGVFGDATAVNIVYSSRGLWSVLAVWLIGHWFANEEQHLGQQVLRGRLLGASLMLVAIVLVIW